MLRIVIRVSAIVGLTLLLLALIGTVRSIRYPALDDPESSIHARITLSPEEFLQQSRRLQGEPAKEYVTRVTHVMHHTLTNVDLAADQHAFRIPLTENYLLFMRSFTDPTHFASVDLCDMDKALERGVGLCSQQAMTMLEVFEDNDIKANYTELQGHVIVSVLVDEKKQIWWSLDPDSDVVIPYDLEAIEKNPSLIRPFYAEQNIDRSRIDTLVSMYGKEGNHSAPLSNGYFLDMCEVQYRSYEMIWVLPILLLLPWTIMSVITLKRKRSHKAHHGKPL